MSCGLIERTIPRWPLIRTWSPTPNASSLLRWPVATNDVAAVKLVHVGDHRLLNGDSREHDPWFRAAARAQYLFLTEPPSKPQRRLRSCPGFSARPLRHEGGRTYFSPLNIISRATDTRRAAPLTGQEDEAAQRSYCPKDEHLKRVHVFRVVLSTPALPTSPKRQRSSGVGVVRCKGSALAKPLTSPSRSGRESRRRGSSSCARSPTSRRPSSARAVRP